MILKIIIWWWPQVYNEFKEYEKQIKFKVVKVMKFSSNTASSHLLLNIYFNNEFWRSHLQINTKVEVTMKIIQIKPDFATTFGCLTKKTMV